MFNELSKNVMTARNNYGAPEEFKHLTRVDSRDMIGKTITIDKVIARNKIKVNSETREPLKTRKGEDIYQTVLYVAFDKDKYFACKSPILIEEMIEFSGIELVYRERKDIVVDNISGYKVKISTGKVRYANKQNYDNIIFVDAEE